MILTSMVIFLGGTIWTVVYSFTNSKLLPRLNFVGIEQYQRLWAARRWVVSIENLAILRHSVADLQSGHRFHAGGSHGSEDPFRERFSWAIFLYPFALSFIVTGLVWQWILNPEFGVQAVVRSLGWTSFKIRPALYVGNRHLRGADRRPLAGHRRTVMCLMLAGLRGIDEDIWKASASMALT